jgi:hypothetical protein
MQNNFFFSLINKMNEPHPILIESGWVETPKLRQRAVEKRNAVSVPTTPMLQSSNHFDLLSPPQKKHSKKRKRPHSKNSPLSQEIHHDEKWDHVVPTGELEGLRIISNRTPDVRQISFLDYLKDELTVADFDSVQDLKRERITNFLAIPAAIEKVKVKQPIVITDYLFS